MGSGRLTEENVREANLPGAHLPGGEEQVLGTHPDEWHVGVVCSDNGCVFYGDTLADLKGDIDTLHGQTSL